MCATKPGGKGFPASWTYPPSQFSINMFSAFRNCVEIGGSSLGLRVPWGVDSGVSFREACHHHSGTLRVGTDQTVGTVVQGHKLGTEVDKQVRDK